MRTVDKTWLKDFVGQLADDLGHEGGLGVGEEGDGCHQRPAVEEDHVLKIINIERSNYQFYVLKCEYCIAMRGHSSSKATKNESSCPDEIPLQMLPMGIWGPENMKIENI